ncbi:hypothetical protein FDECE_13471 [Fusarium decemcellulare]|nr:hypothetical protein FDECE_13471 [Fusarium decemcellulare]
MSTAKSLFRAAAFGLWSLLFGFLTGKIIYWDLANITAVIAVLFLLGAMTLEAFLLFKTVSYIPAISSWTARLNFFFYESRDSAMLLPILSLVWLLNLFIVGGVVIVDLAVGGPISQMLSFMVKHGAFWKAVATVLYICGVLYYFALVAWVFYAGIKAMYRVVRQLKTPEEEAAVALIAGTKDDDEWNDWQDNHGN